MRQTEMAWCLVGSCSTMVLFAVEDKLHQELQTFGGLVVFEKVDITPL